MRPSKPQDKRRHFEYQLLGWISCVTPNGANLDIRPEIVQNGYNWLYEKCLELYQKSKKQIHRYVWILPGGHKAEWLPKGVENALSPNGLGLLPRQQRQDLIAALNNMRKAGMQTIVYQGCPGAILLTPEIIAHGAISHFQEIHKEYLHHLLIMWSNCGYSPSVIEKSIIGPQDFVAGKNAEMYWPYHKLVLTDQQVEDILANKMEMPLNLKKYSFHERGRRLEDGSELTGADAVKDWVETDKKLKLRTIASVEMILNLNIIIDDLLGPRPGKKRAGRPKRFAGSSGI